MHEQIADGHLARYPRIVHLKARQPIDDFVVPADLALVGQNAERGHRKRLARRAGGKNRIGVNRIRRPQALDAEPLGQSDLVIIDDRDRHAGNADVLAQFFNPALEAGGWSRNGRRDAQKRQERWGEKFYANSGMAFNARISADPAPSIPPAAGASANNLA